MKISMKRLGAFVLALVMVFGLIPVMNNTANAVDVTGLTDKAIGVSYALGNNPSTTAGVTAPVGNALTIVGGGKLVGSNYMISTNTVTITNNKGAEATLSFDYTLSGTFGTVAIDGKNYTAATTSSYEKELAAGESITIKVTPKRTAKTTGGNDLTMTITNLTLSLANSGPVTATFEAPAYGSYTVAYGEQTLTVAAGTASQSVTNENSVGYTLTAVPGEGYKLVGWYDSDSGDYISTASSFVATFDKNVTIRPVIVPENSAVFMVGSDENGYNYYTDLNEAVDYALANDYNQVTLVQSGILENNGKDYVIPAGITLLIPMDTAYTATGFDEFGPAPEFTTEVVTPYAFLTLTLGEGVVLEINGTLDIESMHTTAQGSGSARPYGGRPSGPYGAIFMSPETSITVNDGGSVYAWGYIYGQGVVNAYDGAKVYELMQVLDFPGGGNMAGFVDNDLAFDFDGDTNPTNDYIKTFPFSQYYVQNIEVELNLYAGATEYVYIAMTAASISMGMPVQFIGENGMFSADNGVITKKYDPSTDRLEVTVDGDASMSGITLDMTGTAYESAMLQFLGVSKVDSATFILTLNSNITIDIVSGTTTVQQDLALLPGVEVYVREGASMVIAQREMGEYDNLTVYGTGGYNVYLWDKENWGKYAFSNQYLIPLSYSPTAGRYKRSASDLKDVVLCIDGTVIVEGFIYSTVTFDEEAWMPVSGGASVISNGTGKLVLTNGCGTEDLAYCLDGSSSRDHNMFVDSVWLQNEDGSFLLTQCDYCSGLTDETVEECQHYGMEYNYCDVHGCWYTSGHGNCTDAVEITWVINGQGQTMEVTVGQVPAYPITPSKPQSGCTIYTFAGWAASADGEVLAELPVATADAVYYAIFTESVSHSGGTAYCNELKICAACGERYGSLDPNNHKEVGYYENEADNKHHIYYSCCGTYGASEPCSDMTGDGDHGCDKCVNNGITDCVSDAAHDCQNGVCVECGTEMPAVRVHEFEYECDKNCSICGDEVWPSNDHNQENGCDTQCQYCGEEIWPDAVCVSDAAYSCVDGNCIYCGEPVSASENHDWLDATCTEAATCGNCGATTGSALGHGTIEGWDYVQIDNDVHQVWCKDCWDYTYEDGHDYVNHVCSECGCTEQMSVKFYNGTELWTETTASYGGTLGIAGMPVPEAPTGYKFAGWYTDGGVHVVHGMTVTSEIVAYATWAKQTFTVTWLFNGGVMDEQTKQLLISEGFTVTDTSVSGTFPYDDFAPHAPGVTKDGYILIGYTDQNGKFNAGQESFTLTEDMTYTMVWECAHSDKTYTDLGNGFHKVTCDACSETLVESEGHDYTYDKRYHKCQCGAVEEFKLTVVYGVNGEYTFEAMLPYWTRMDSLDVINNIPWFVYVNDATHMGYFYLDDFYWDMDGDGDLDRDRYFTEGYMTDEDMYVEARYDFNGFVHDGNGWKYRDYGRFYKNQMVMLTKADVYENGSDEELEGIYMVGADGYRIENGMGRWYYLGYNPFSGITYEPNAEDIAYYESKGQTFIDKEMTWYYFGADGKMAENYTGLVGDSYVINGQAAWHIGLVEIDGEYYYFKGDEVNGGNKMVSGGDFYLNRNNSDFNMVVGGIYTFDNDGKMQWKFHGIVESDLFEGKRHYIGGRLTPGLGLMDLTTAGTSEVRYFYVDSYGQLILDAEYYIGANSFGLAKGIYYFDAEGFLVIPEEEPGKSGLFFEEGKWYYYVDGAKAYCAGLIEIDGNWVYVKSDGSLATGVYYVTNTNNHPTISSGDKCLFDENGFMQEALNGIIDGYYYVDNQIAYAAGLIEIDGIYYYVRSNGQIVTDCQYWITNVNDTGYEPGLYEFNADGWMSEIYVETFTGIKDGYFYVNDEIAYNAGLKQYNGGYIYVRSNGQIATGKYWITNHNGLLPEGFYDFGEDGFYYPPVPENAYLVKDVVKNTETDGFGAYYGSAEAIIPQEDGILYIQVTDITWAEEILNEKGFHIGVESSNYWERELDAQAVGPQTVILPVKAGIDYILFVNPADLDAEGCTVINGTISYKIWSTVECELKEVSIGE